MHFEKAKRARLYCRTCTLFDKNSYPMARPAGFQKTYLPKDIPAKTTPKAFPRDSGEKTLATHERPLTHPMWRRQQDLVKIVQQIARLKYVQMQKNMSKQQADLKLSGRK